MHQWTETAIATALEGRFYLTDGSDRNALLREEEEKRQRQRAELIRQRTKQKVEEAVINNGPTDPASIISVVAHAHGISTADLISRTRAHHIIRARQHACALLRELAQLPFQAIANAVSLKDHSTAHWACKCWAKLAPRYAEADAQARKMLGLGG
jgi:chromosomal replication initiation ATPase DnaA